MIDIDRLLQIRDDIDYDREQVAKDYWMPMRQRERMLREKALDIKAMDEAIAWCERTQLVESVS